MSGLRDKMRDDDRAFDDLKFELEQKLKDMEASIKSLTESLEGSFSCPIQFRKLNLAKQMKNGPTEEVSKVDIKQNAEVLAKLEKLESSHFTITGKTVIMVSLILCWIKDNVEEFNRQLKDENKKIQAVEGEVSELVIARNQLNLRMTDYEAEGIDMKTKCDDLKRTG